MRLALHQPDIAGNVGNIARLTACMGVPLDIVMPCGFAFSDRAFRRAGMDYAQMAEVRRWPDFATLLDDARGNGARIMLLTSSGDIALGETRFHRDDMLLFGSEGSGVPANVHAAADARIRIPMRTGFRSLNIAVAAGIALAEALRQTGGWPQ